MKSKILFMKDYPLLMLTIFFKVLDHHAPGFSANYVYKILLEYRTLAGWPIYRPLQRICKLPISEHVRERIVPLSIYVHIHVNMIQFERNNSLEY